MAEPKKTAPAAEETTAADAAAVEAGTNAQGVDLNDPSLKGGTDNPEAQAANEERMNVGTDRPVVEQIQSATPESVPDVPPPAETK